MRNIGRGSKIKNKRKNKGNAAHFPCFSILFPLKGVFFKIIRKNIDFLYKKRYIVVCCLLLKTDAHLV